MSTLTQDTGFVTSAEPPLNHSKPTLLTFHGSGSTAIIHKVQLARLHRILQPWVNIVHLEAPFPSPAGPGILPMFDGCGPFKRWLHPSEKATLESMRLGQSSNAMPAEVEDLIRSTVQKIRAEGGRVVGLIGFSQGTKVVAGLLRGAEITKSRKGEVEGKEEGDGDGWCDFQFALSVCGSYPPPLYPQSVTSSLSSSADEQKALLDQRITIPTLHVIGKHDEWNWAGKGLIDNHYDVGEGKSEILETNVGHQYPLAAEETEKLANWVIGMVKRSEEVRRR